MTSEIAICPSVRKTHFFRSPDLPESRSRKALQSFRFQSRENCWKSLPDNGFGGSNLWKAAVFCTKGRTWIENGFNPRFFRTFKTHNYSKAGTIFWRKTSKTDGRHQKLQEDINNWRKTSITACRAAFKHFSIEIPRTLIPGPGLFCRNPIDTRHRVISQSSDQTWLSSIENSDDKSNSNHRVGHDRAVLYRTVTGFGANESA